MKNLLSPVYWMISFLGGYLVFILTGKTPLRAYNHFRRLACATDGKLNLWFAKLESCFSPPYIIEDESGILDLSSDRKADILHNINEKGFYVFSEKLPDRICKELVNLALNTPAFTIPTYASKATQYKRHKPIATKYDFPEQTLLENQHIQSLATDRSIFTVSQGYLGAKPICDLVAMWWSTPYSPIASSEAAQLYHFDMDRIKFIKFFIYLTDVTPKNGPHCYVAGSHRNKPKLLRRDGRIADAEIEQYYQPNEIIEITGKAGTIIAADTSGFHKGKPLSHGDRLMLQIEFCTSLFGERHQKIIINEKFQDDFVTRAKRYKHTYSRFLSRK